MDRSLLAYIKSVPNMDRIARKSKILVGEDGDSYRVKVSVSAFTPNTGTSVVLTRGERFDTAPKTLIVRHRRDSYLKAYVVPSEFLRGVLEHGISQNPDKNSVYVKIELLNKYEIYSESL